MDIEHNKAVIRAIDDLRNGTGDIERLDELCMPDIINHALAPGRPQGIDGTRELLRSARRDIHPGALDRVARGGRRRPRRAVRHP